MKKTYAVVFILPLLVTLWEGSYADASVLCAPKSGEGAIKVREACKKNEKQLDPVSLGLRGPGAVVKDANGAFVGIVLEQSGRVLQQVGDIGVHFQIADAGFPEDVVRLEHESTDCSGPGFFQAPQLGLLRPGFVRGAKVYYALNTTTVITRSVSQSPVQLANCPVNPPGRIFIPPNICCDKIGPEPREVGPADELDLSHLVPPFRLEVQE